MGATVIQHRKGGRKRAGSTWAWAARRAGVLSVTILGLAAATWVAPLLDRPAPLPPPPALAHAGMPILPAAYPDLADIDVRIDLAGPPAPVSRPRARPLERGIPLNGVAQHHGDDYEILSAAELASISQARD